MYLSNVIFVINSSIYSEYYCFVSYIIIILYSLCSVVITVFTVELIDFNAVDTKFNL